MEKDKKYNIVLGIMIFFFVLFVAVCIAWGLSRKTDLNKQTNSVRQEENTSINQTEEVNPVEEAYKKYDFNWISKNRSQITYVEDGKIIINGLTREQKILKFDYGTPIMSAPLPGQAFNGIAVLNESGEAYEVEFLNEDYTKIEVKRVNVDEKIVDISSTGGNGSAIYYGPYYLTETGRVIDLNNKTYEEINKNHISTVGTAGYMVYICEDETIDIPRANSTYIKVITSNGINIKVKNIFCDVSGNEEVFYMIDKNDKIYVLRASSNAIAYEYEETRGRTVKSVKYDSENNKVKLTLDNENVLNFNEVYSAYDLIKDKNM